MILKNIIKNSFNLPVYKLILILNREILLWNRRGYFTINLKEVGFEMDLYLYKLLWKFLKRIHPRRSNTWLYTKYWKNFSGIWRFFSFDPKKNIIIYLVNHYSEVKDLYFLPSLFNFFYLQNIKKIATFCFNTYKFYFRGFIYIVFVKQKSLCYRCSQVLKPFTFKLAYIYGSRVPILLHDYC